MRFDFARLIKEKFGIQVFVAITALVFLLSLSFIVLLCRFQDATMIAELESNGKLIAEILSYQSRIALYSENEEMLRIPAESPFQNAMVIGVCLFNQEGELVIERRRQSEADALHSARDTMPDIRELIQQLSQTSAPLIFHTDNFLVVWQPVVWGNTFPVEDTLYPGEEPDKPGDGPFGYVKITLGKRQLKEKLRSNLLKTVLLGGGFLIMGALIAYFLAMQIHRPIKQLTDNVRRFGEEGDCGDLTVKSRNEIGELSRAFQEMTYSLKGYVQREIDTAKELAHNRNLAHLGVASSKVTHEVGNLLNNMSMVLTALKSESLSDSGNKRILLLEKEAKRLQAFISDFLQFARKPVLQSRTALFGLTLKEIIVAHQPQADTLGIELKLDWPETIPPVTADHRMLGRAIANLVTNSMAAVGRGGTVTISGRVKAQHLVISVEDTGSGIEPAVLERIFEPFFTTKGPHGTGLGLSIVQGIVQGHGGTIACESSPGEGTRFIIRLPRV
jgi:signal transduction histidine kinase